MCILLSLFPAFAAGEGGLPDTPNGNLCRPSDGVTVTATASSNETANVTPDKAIDGGFTNSGANDANVERWASNTNAGGQWLQINLGTLRTVSVVKIFWQHDSVTAYHVEISANGTDWTQVYDHPASNGRITELNKTITFAPQACQYIKITATEYDDQGSGHWANVSIWEVEAYRDEDAIPQTPASVLERLLALGGDLFEVNGAGTHVVLTEAAQAKVPDGFTVTFAANLEQVVGEGGVIYTPIVDKTVAFDLTVTNEEGETASSPASSPIRFVVPGTHTAAESTGNVKPAVVPEIMEWYSDSTGKFRLNENSRIIHRYGANGGYNEVANQLTADVKELFGIELEHVHTAQTYQQILDELRPGDIIIYNVLDNGIATNRIMVDGFDSETYRMDVTDTVRDPDGNLVLDADGEPLSIPHVVIYARGTDAGGNGVDGTTGAYWATRTLLQGMLLNEDGEGNYFPYGIMRDYPEFKVRGTILDVGRKPVSMDMLQEIVKNMAWYKMNDFHIHLNDNLIFLEDYIPGWRSGQPTAASDYAKANAAYSAFRLESSVQEEADGIPLTAQDYAYTKAEFQNLVNESALIGVNIVPEIDAPAHAKAITDAFPSLRLYNPNGMNSHPYNDHLNLGDATYVQSLGVIKSIFNEYLEDDNPVFGGIVHLGADEYYDDHAAYRRFVKDMVDYLKEQGRTPRVWGSLKSMSSNPTKYPASDIDAEGVQMNIWSLGWADPADSFNMGFDLINCLDGPNYMVPHSGYYHPNGLGTAAFTWAPNNFGGTWIPASSSQMLGGAFALWNDSIDTRANGVDEQDIFQLFFEPIPYYATSLWGHNGMTLAEVQESVATVGYAPQTNPAHEIGLADGAAQYFRYNFTDTNDSSGNGHDLTLHNATVQGGVLSLNGGSSYVETGLDRLPWGSQLTFKAKKLEGGGAAQIIFAGDHAYGDFTIEALPVSGDNDHWKLGFSRELYDFVYEDALLPVGEWVTLTLVNNRRDTVLYVDNGDTAYKATGYFLPDENSNTQFRGVSFVSGTNVTGSVAGGSSFNIPVTRIGSKANAFKGLLDDISATPVGAAFETVEPDKYDIKPSENGYTASAVTQVSSDPPSNVYDGDPDTFYHSNYSGSNTFDSLPADQRWFQIELAVPAAVAGLRYLPRQNSANGRIKGYKIEVSTDGETYTPVLTDGIWADDTSWKTARFDAQNGIKYIRLFGLDTGSDAAGAHLTIAELRILRPIYWEIDGAAAISLDETSYPLVNGAAEPDPIVTFDGAVLTKDKDYTLSYQNNTAVGTATVTVTGKGGYVGTLSTTFTVTQEAAPIDLSNAAVTFAQTSYPLVDGKATPDPKVVLSGVTLLNGLDYEVTYANNTRVGTATATITGIGAYTGETSATFTVTAAVARKDLSNASHAKVTLHQLDFVYTGEPITPEPIVTYDGVTLTRGTHYTVFYFRNTAVGTATVTVTGIAPYYEGSASVTFAIINPTTDNDLSDASRTEIILNPEEYLYTGNDIIPTFTVIFDGHRLTEGVDYTVQLSNNRNAGTGILVIRGEGEYYGSCVATFTIVPDPDAEGNTGTGGGSTGDSGGGSTGGSGSGSTGGSGTGGVSGNVDVTTTTGDGVTTTVRTDSSGAMSVQASYDDGTTVSADIPVSGPVTATVTVPFNVERAAVTIPTRDEPGLGQVAVILHPDGTREIVKTAVPTEDGMELTLDASAVIQIVDNTKSFIDVSANHWAKDAITFVTAREIFNGTGNNTFSPGGDMSRAMVCTVLANLTGVDTKGGSTWYDKAIAWAQTEGISDGTAPDSTITREQLAVMLYRYAGSPTVINEVPRRFRDRGSVSDWAELAVTWAVENDLIRGRGSQDGLDLAPQDTATRAEVAAVFQRYVFLIK